MRNLLSYLKFIFDSHPWFVLLALLTGVATVYAAASLYGLATYLILFTSLHPTIDLIMIPVVGVRFFGISRAALRYCDRLVSHNVTFRVLSELRVYFYKKLELIVNEFKSKKERSSYLSVAISDIENLQDTFLRLIAPLFVAVFVLGISAAIINFVHFYFSIVIICGLLLSICSAFALAQPVNHLISKLIEKKSLPSHRN